MMIMDCQTTRSNYRTFVVAGRVRMDQNNRLTFDRIEYLFFSRKPDRSMLFEQIEKKKREFTDKYVMVDPSRPELARFRDIVGQVKTVNMSGRALVEFMDYHLNVGWYDIDPTFLKIVDKPAPKAVKPEAKKVPAKPKPTGEAASAAGKTPAAKASASAAKPGKPSVAEILAAARAGKGEAASAAVKAKPPTTPATGQPAAPKPAAVDRSKMSVADMLAAARAGGAGGAAKPQAAPPVAKPQAVPVPVEEETATAAAPTPHPVKSTEKIDKSKMSIADMIAWCQQHDAK
jgi:hypothetical protein